MKEIDSRGSIGLVLAVVVGLLVFVCVIFLGLLYFNSVISTQKPVDPLVNSDKSDLKFLDKSDVQDIDRAIDSASSLPDIDAKFYNTFSDVLDKTNKDNSLNSDKYLISPEFLSDNPEGVQITNKSGQTVDLLAGLNLAPLENRDLPKLKKFAKLWIEEIAKYPLSWQNFALPPVIVFVKGIKVETGEAAGGVETGVIVYDINGIEDEAYAKKLIHHELMHWIERKTMTYNDPNWPATQEEYANSYNLTSVSNYSIHPKDGFVTGYAMTNSTEDRAEVYAYLFTKEGQKDLENFSMKDPQLKAKADYLKMQIKTVVSKMDESYFENYIGQN